MSNTIYPCLWFDNNAAEAAAFYCSLFKDSKITTNTPMVVNFELKGRKFMGLNGGPQFKLNEAMSIVVECESQEEIDFYWEKLTAGGQESMCGWLQDRFGVWWQIIPAVLSELMIDSTRGQRVMEALLNMKKLNIAELKEAYGK